MFPSLTPQENFPIVYVIADPNDANTYFVRSVMRNSATGNIIKIGNANFVNLTSLGSGRFSKTIQAPNENTGLGFWIDIVTTVYTDAGYTTPSSSYEQRCDRYLVQTRWTQAYGTGGGGYSKPEKEFDFTKLKEVVLEAFNGLPTTEMPEFDYKPITTRLDRALRLIESIEMPQIPDVKPVDLTPHTKAIIKEIQANKPDLSPVLEKIDGIEFPEIPNPKDYTETHTKILNLLEEIKTVLPQNKYNQFLDQVAESVVSRKKNIKDEPSAERLQKLLV